MPGFITRHGVITNCRVIRLAAAAWHRCRQPTGGARPKLADVNIVHRIVAVDERQVNVDARIIFMFPRRGVGRN